MLPFWVGWDNAQTNPIMLMMLALGGRRKAAGPAPAARPEIRPCSRAPGLSRNGAYAADPPLPVHHRTSVSPRAPPGPQPKTAPKFARAPTANPDGTEGFFKHFWGPKNPQHLHHEHGPF